MDNMTPEAKVARKIVHCRLCDKGDDIWRIVDAVRLEEEIAAAIREAVEAERKACAEIARAMTGRIRGPITREVAKAIEARGEGE